MKAAVITAPGKMDMLEQPIPVPAAGEALIRIAYTGLCGSDVHIYKGESSKAKPNVIVRHEYSGITASTGNTGPSRQGEVRTGIRWRP